MSYPSDVTDAEWDEIKDFFTPEHPGRPRKWEMRAIYNAIRYVQRTGCQWRLLPTDFPPWSVVYMTLYRQRQAGLWERINTRVRGQVREQVGKSLKPSVAILDSQTVKTVQKGGSGASMAARRSRAASGISR